MYLVPDVPLHFDSAINVSFVSKCSLKDEFQCRFFRSMNVKASEFREMDKTLHLSGANCSEKQMKSLKGNQCRGMTELK